MLTNMPESRRIAVAVQIDEPYPHHQQLFAGIQQSAQARDDWQCFIDEHPGYDARRRRTPENQYDGVIARASVKMQRRLSRLHIPLVNTLFQTQRAGLPAAFADPWAMGRLAAEHLLDRAFRRLCVLVDRRHKHSWEICQGFVRRAEEADVVCVLHDLPEEPYEDSNYWLHVDRLLIAAIEELTSPVAVFVETAPVARLMVQHALARRWRVPHDMAILCAHDLKAVVSVPPQISSLQPNCERVGYEAARLLDKLMAGGDPPTQPVYVPPIGIIARESTDYFAVQDETVVAALHHISRHLSKPLRVPEIAAAVAVSPRLLQARFDEALGRSITDEIRRLRLEAAKRMLAEPGRQVQEVAAACGFNSSDIMGQVFRRELGITPRGYRKQAKRG